MRHGEKQLKTSGFDCTQHSCVGTNKRTKISVRFAYRLMLTSDLSCIKTLIFKYICFNKEVTF